jgi:hypothetical protein
MVDRLLMEENRFRISHQGFDVNTASNRQLAFSESRLGLIPAAKGNFTGTTTIALPEAGYVPLMFIYLVQGTVLGTINAAKTVVTIAAQGVNVTPSGRYIIFKNRQY